MQEITNEYTLGLAPTAIYGNNTALGHRSLNGRHGQDLPQGPGGVGVGGVGGEGGPRMSGSRSIADSIGRPVHGSVGPQWGLKEEAPRGRLSVSEMGLGLPSPILVARGKGTVRSLKVRTPFTVLTLSIVRTSFTFLFTACTVRSSPLNAAVSPGIVRIKHHPSVGLPSISLDCPSRIKYSL